MIELFCVSQKLSNSGTFFEATAYKICVLKERAPLVMLLFCLHNTYYVTQRLGLLFCLC